MKIIDSRNFTDAELDELYGERKYKYGTCFEHDGHYMQRESDVLPFTMI